MIRTRTSQPLTTLLLLALTTAFFGCGQGNSGTTPIQKVERLVFEKKYTEARASCDELLSLDPKNYEALLLRGDINQRIAAGQDGSREQYEPALADFGAAIELNPTRHEAYHLRYQLYSLLSKQSTDSTEKRLLDEASAQDWEKVRVYDPAAVITFKDDKQSIPKSLEKPVPGLTFEPGIDSTSDSTADGEPVTDADPFTEDQFTKADDQQTTTEDVDPSATDEAEAAALKATQSAKEAIAAHKKQIDQLKNRTYADVPKNDNELTDEEAIKQKELGNDELTDFSLPPEQGTSLPQKPVTRFDLGSFQPTVPNQSFVLPVEPITNQPQQRRGATTGITSQPNDAEPEQQPGQQYGRQQGQPGFGAPGYRGTSPLVRQPRTTGIRGGSTSRSTAPNLQRGAFPGSGPFAGPLGAPTTGPGGTAALSGPTGFLPPDAQGAFGPRLAPQQQRAAGGEPSEEKGPRRLTPRPGSPILTTAIPGTTMIYGQQTGAQGRAKGNLAPSLSDPKYTPYVPRPTTRSTLPTLPDPY